MQMIPRSIAAIGFLIAFAFPLLVPCQVYSQEEGNHFHWAYSSAFGTGAYRIGDGSVYVIAFKPKLDLRGHTKLELDLKLTLPVSFGLQTIDIDDILSDELPDQLSTGSFTPGLELMLPLGEHWMLKPFANIGVGRSINTVESAWIFFGGVQSRYRLDWGNTKLGLLNEVLLAGYQPDPGDEDGFARFMLGLEADYPLGGLQFRGSQLFLQPHLLYYHYFGTLDSFFENLTQNNGLTLNEEVEVAVAVGMEEPQKIWFFRPDRLGIGFRWSQDLAGVRLFIRSVFN
jgi:hypothetical protein